MYATAAASVKVSLMPKGVEHKGALDATNEVQNVKVSLMPKGVEHQGHSLLSGVPNNKFQFIKAFSHGRLVDDTAAVGGELAPLEM